MPRLFILANEEKHFHPEFYDEVLRRKPEQYTLVGAALAADPTPMRESFRTLFGLSGAAGICRLAWQLGRQRLARARQRPPRLSVDQVLRAHGVVPSRIQSPNDPEFTQGLARMKPDVVYCSVSAILKPLMLSVPSLGCVNRHAGLLPSYRGIEPVFHALRNGEKEVTITYHRMDSRIDAGVVLWEHHEPVQHEDTVYSLYGKLFRASVFGFWDALRILESGGGCSVDVAQGNYFRYPTREQIAEFRARGRRYV